MDIAPPLPPAHGSYAPPLAKPTGKSNAAQTAADTEHSDFLAIDDLLDFSNEDIGGPIEPCLSNATSCELKIEPPLLPAFDRKLSQPCGFDSNSLCVPCDDVAELEWLSNFVEESFSSGDAPACLGWGSHGSLGDDDKGEHHRRSSDESFRTTSPVSVLESNTFPRGKHCTSFSFSPDMSPVPGRARSKRCRTAVCFWNTRILSPEVSESLLETASTTYAIQAASSESNMYNTYYDYDDDDDDEDEDFVRIQGNQRMKNSAMKVKNSSFSKSKSSTKLFNPKPKKTKVEDATPVRKCLHCATQKTPQWRAGPMGPKTLCNACGVRYKSGRLCDEYRPAASPTFVESVHSNSHRKVLEMRRQRGDSIGHESQKHKENTHRLRGGDSGACALKVDVNTNALSPSEETKVGRSE
ncbi:hypothetical protein GOP47_0011324 [Adiantum capillus-veneris]|uniref:GATA transcription factor n=1 Tax=Adiantum capillus-veneris TaxID=13818 RepID=A0A9D4USQ6_ADICA|nr:hypothetical protein GOP47_0011324 [Adiantum capillus-veneris]